MSGKSLDSLIVINSGIPEIALKNMNTEAEKRKHEKPIIRNSIDDVKGMKGICIVIDPSAYISHNGKMLKDGFGIEVQAPQLSTNFEEVWGIISDFPLRVAVLDIPKSVLPYKSHVEAMNYNGKKVFTDVFTPLYQGFESIKHPEVIKGIYDSIDQVANSGVRPHLTRFLDYATSLGQSRKGVTARVKVVSPDSKTFELTGNAVMVEFVGPQIGYKSSSYIRCDSPEKVQTLLGDIRYVCGLYNIPVIRADNKPKNV